ncbi:MAG: DNA polymerase Y family protein, partial [Hyphomonas sp.]
MNATARAGGLHPGMRVSDARASLPHLGLEQIDRDADAAGLRALADWMVRASPHVALDGPEGLMLETTGCAHLFGGEAGMTAMLSERLGASGYTHRLAFAGTP